MRTGGSHGKGLAQAIQGDRNDHDRQAGFDATADIQAAERRQHVVAEPAGPDHGGDDHHVEGQHDDLVHADHQRRHRGRHQDLSTRAARACSPTMCPASITSDGTDLSATVEMRTIGGMA